MDEWPTDIAIHGGGFLPHLLLSTQAELRMSTGELVVLLHVISWNWSNEPSSLPNKQTISRRMGKDAITVYRHLRSLESKGYIRAVRNFTATGKQIDNSFDLTGLIGAMRSIAVAKQAEQNHQTILEFQDETALKGRVRFNQLTYDFDLQKLIRSDQAIVQLTANDTSLLEALILRPNHIYSRDELYDYVRGNSNRRTDRAIDLAIARLRRKLSYQGAYNLIKTVRGEGYTFTGNVVQMRPDE